MKKWGALEVTCFYTPAEGYIKQSDVFLIYMSLYEICGVRNRAINKWHGLTTLYFQGLIFLTSGTPYSSGSNQPIPSNANPYGFAYPLMEYSFMHILVVYQV